MDKETAMKILKELHGKSLFAERTALETIVPELRDSEDERIRKDLLAFIKAPYVYDFIVHDRVDPWIAWIEKQKPTEWSEEDEKCLINAIDACLRDYGLSSDTVKWLETLKDRIKGKEEL